MQLSDDIPSTSSDPTPADLPPFQIIWHPPDAGWIDVTIRRGNEDVEIQAGYREIFRELVAWVKRCGDLHNPPQSFLWDGERVEYHFTYFPRGRFLRIEEVDWTDGPPPVTWQGTVSFKELRQGFYVDLLRHLEDPGFAEEHWFHLTARSVIEYHFPTESEGLIEEASRLDKAAYDRFCLGFLQLLVPEDTREFGIRTAAAREQVRALCEGRQQTDGYHSLDWSTGSGRWTDATPSERRAILETFLTWELGYGGESYPWVLRDAELDAWQEPES